tara:strand:+ start:345 stop:566 length:222 start_codon:yes stop_codon:yes gene_type:complete
MIGKAEQPGDLILNTMTEKTQESIRILLTENNVNELISRLIMTQIDSIIITERHEGWKDGFNRAEEIRKTNSK